MPDVVAAAVEVDEAGKAAREGGVGDEAPEGRRTKGPPADETVSACACDLPRTARHVLFGTDDVDGDPEARRKSVKSGDASVMSNGCG